MPAKGRNRVVITNVSPQLEHGLCSIKRCLGDAIVVEADIFTDGHNELAAELLYQKQGDTHWQQASMQLIDNDRYCASFLAKELGVYLFKLHAWIDTFATWQKDLMKKRNAGINLATELEIGQSLIKQVIDNKLDKNLSLQLAALKSAKTDDEACAIVSDTTLLALMSQSFPNKRFVTEYDTPLSVVVEPLIARFSAWYELFPRSCSNTPGAHGTFTDCMAKLDTIAAMGFDIVYLPPIHPIGTSFRKGKNNQLVASPTDPGSPWAIGAPDGGHKAIHKELGTEQEFDALVTHAHSLGMQIALDIAFQCSADHPYLTEHPEWFSHLPDGTIKHAENPPKKYEDIVPFNFECDAYQALWQELLDIILYWCKKGIRTFRVDNPHTKPFCFWQWVITEVKNEYPEAIFLSEAFTRPKVMHWLAKVGFSQSYTYFTWRYTKNELTSYMKEITKTGVSNYFRPNFWPTTPDILPLDLQYYGAPAFKSRLLLAATLSSNYGLYGPAFEQMINDAITGSEEYLNAEKYEIKEWEIGKKSPIVNLMTKINIIRRENPALQQTNEIQFLETNNSQVICYAKPGPDLLIVVVNLDPCNTHTVTITLPQEPHQSYRVHELLEDRRFISDDKTLRVTIDPKNTPGHIYKLLTPLLREKSFDYFM